MAIDISVKEFALHLDGDPGEVLAQIVRLLTAAADLAEDEVDRKLSRPAKTNP